MKLPTLRGALAATALVAGGFGLVGTASVIAPAVASATSGYACASNATMKACFQIAGSGNFVEGFNYEITNLTARSITVNVVTNETTAAPTYRTSLTLGAHSTAFDVDYGNLVWRNLPSGWWTATFASVSPAGHVAVAQLVHA